MDPRDPARESRDVDQTKDIERRIGGYRILREIGRGSMGIVYEARDEARDQRVALKILLGASSIEEKAVRRFLREAQMLERIRHPNIVPIYRFGEERGTYFFAMQFIDGQTIASLVRKGPIEPRRAAEIARQAAVALDCAHRATIVHRDIKPANLILDTNDNVLLMDFGLATHDRAATITDSGALVGTPMYMSPEQVTGAKGEVDSRTDVYSLGATLYEMLAGRPPFDSGNVQSILRQIVELDPPSPRRFSAAVPRDLATITLKAMEKRPESRFASAHELAMELDRFLKGERIKARRASSAKQLLRRARRHPRVAALVGTVAVLLAAGAALLVRQMRVQSRANAHQALVASADSAERAGDYPLARARLNEAIEQHPDDPALKIKRALVRAKSGDRDGARDDLRSAARLAPRRAEPWIELGRLEREWGNRDAALQAYEEGKKSEPNSSASYLAIADVAIAEDNMLRAQSVLEEAKALAPNDREVIQALAAIVERRGRQEEASRYLKALQLLNPLRSAPAGLGGDVVDTASKQIADLAGLKTALEKTPETASSLLTQIKASLAQASIRELKSKLRESTDEAENAGLRVKLIDAYLEVGDADSAAYHCIAATQSTPRDPELWRRLAQIHLSVSTWNKADPKEALRCAQRAAELAPSEPSYQELLADAYAADGRREDAIRVLDLLLSGTPDGTDRDRYLKSRERYATEPPR